MNAGYHVISSREIRRMCVWTGAAKPWYNSYSISAANTCAIQGFVYLLVLTYMINWFIKPKCCGGCRGRTGGSARVPGMALTPGCGGVRPGPCRSRSASSRRQPGPPPFRSRSRGSLGCYPAPGPRPRRCGRRLSRTTFYP